MKAKLIVEEYKDGTFAFVLEVYDPVFMTELGDEPVEGEDGVNYLVSKFFKEKIKCRAAGEDLAKRLSLDYEIARRSAKGEKLYEI